MDYRPLQLSRLYNYLELDTIELKAIQIEYLC